MTTYIPVQKAYDTVWRNGLWKKLWEIGIRGKMWRMMKKMTECARSAVMLDGEISKYVDILQGVAQRCTLSPNLFKIYINDLIVAVEAARQGVTVGEDTVSGLMFADDFVGISETPEGLQKQIEKALEYTRKWRVTANVKKCAVVVCNEDKVNPVNFSWKWGEDELPIVDQYTYLGVEISKDCSWDTHIAKVIGKGKAQVGKMDAILTDSNLDTRIKRCNLMNAKARICWRSMGRERETRKTVGNSTNDSS
ncbi:MAG: reverse transcriptase domain-containing protein [Hyphomicrobiales bacterium]